MSQQAIIREFGTQLTVSTGRIDSRLAILSIMSVCENDEACDENAVTARWNTVGCVAPWIRAVERRASIIKMNTRRLGRSLRSGLYPNPLTLFSGTQICARAETLRSQKKIAITTKQERVKSERNEVYFGRKLFLHAMENLCGLSGSSARQGASVTFRRSCVQMFGDVAHGSLLRRHGLLHQKTGEHCSGRFIEPLFEQSVDFFFQIGRMIQSRKLKRLERRDSGLLKILPRRADTSGTHLGSP
jgi:hypothetical protein